MSDEEQSAIEDSDAEALNRLCEAFEAVASQMPEQHQLIWTWVTTLMAHVDRLKSEVVDASKQFSELKIDIEQFIASTIDREKFSQSVQDFNIEFLRGIIATKAEPPKGEL